MKEFFEKGGVKNEKDFYKKYPTEDAFFKAHPDMFYMKYQVGGQTPVENRMQQKPNPLAITENTQCPQGYYWSSIQNQCIPVNKPKEQISPLASNANVIPQTTQDASDPFGIKKLFPTPEQQKPQAPTDSYFSSPDGKYMPNTAPTEVNIPNLSPAYGTDVTETNSGVSPSNPSGDPSKRKNPFDKFKPQLPGAEVLPIISAGLTMFSTKMEEKRQRDWQQKQMGQINQTYSNAQNDYGVDPYEQTGQYRPSFQKGGTKLPYEEQQQWIYNNIIEKGFNNTDDKVLKFYKNLKQDAANNVPVDNNYDPEYIKQVRKTQLLLAQKALNERGVKYQKGGKIDPIKFLDFLDEEESEDTKPKEKVKKKQSERITEDEVDELTALGLDPMSLVNSQNSYRNYNRRQSNVQPTEALNQVKDYYTSRGYEPSFIAGVMGNIHAESSGNPNAEEDGGSGYGLFQHTGPRRTQLINWANKNGLSPSDPLTQAKFAEQEPDFQKARVKSMGKSASEAAKIFEEVFERPGIKRSDVRMGAANKFMSNFEQGGEFSVDFKTMMELKRRGIKFKMID